MKKFLIISVIVTVMFLTSACREAKPGILFNKYPITADTIMGNEYVFKPNSRIYYLVVLPQKIHSRYAYLQIIKKDKGGYLGYKIYYGKTIRLKNEQVNYYDDYIVISEPGIYVMKIYSKDDPQRILTLGEFYVKE